MNVLQRVLHLEERAAGSSCLSRLHKDVTFHTNARPKIGHISLWGKISARLKRTSCRVGRSKQKNEVTDIHHQHHSGLTRLSVTDVCEAPAAWGTTCCDAYRGVRSYQAAVKTGRPRMKFGRAVGNIRASPWSLWHDMPASKASRHGAQRSASHWPWAILKRPSIIAFTSFEPFFTAQRRRDSQIKAPSNYVHHSQACLEVAGLKRQFLFPIGWSLSCMHSNHLRISIRKSVLHINPSFN